MIYWILATLTAFFIKGLCGFANTLVFTSYYIVVVFRDHLQGLNNC